MLGDGERRVVPAVMFLVSFAWTFVYVGLPFHIHDVTTRDAAGTLAWTGWILGITSLATVVSTPLWARLARDNPREAAELLLYHHISGMPVLDGDGRLVGVVSEIDVIDKQGETVADVMSRRVVSVDATAHPEAIAAVMARAQIKRVPVLQDDVVVGIISRADIVRWAAGGAAPA